MIKKIVKVILATLLIVPSIWGLVGGGMAVRAAEGDATVTIHKKKMTTLPSPLIQNTGEIMADLEAYEGLEGVEFNVYNVSKEYYTLLKDGDSQEDAVDSLKEIIPANDTIAGTGTTLAGGLLNFTLAKKSVIKLEGEDEKTVDSVYLFVETVKAGITKADNMVLIFPVYKMIVDEESGEVSYSDDELDVVHLYPKNTLEKDGSVEVIKRGTADNEGLDGAEFRLQKQVTGINGISETWVATGVADGLYKWGKLEDDDVTPYTFVSGNSYSISGNAIVTTAHPTGSGKLTINNLEYGTYKLVETKAPGNSGMINEFIETEFTISEDKKVVTPEDIMNDTIIVEKTVNDTDHEIGAEIDYAINFKIPMGIQDKVTVDGGEKYRYQTVTLTDTHSEFLTFVDNATKYTLTNDGQQIPQDEYTVTPAADGLSFIVSLKDAAIRRLSPGKLLVFNYKMFLNEGATPDNGFDNKADVVVKGDTDELKGDDDKEVFTGGKRFVKIDGDNGAVIEGAEFVVRDGTGTSAKYLKIDETTKAVTWVDTLKDPVDETKYLATVFTSNGEGIFEVMGLEYGDYYLQEIKSPNDYILLKDLKSFNVSKESYRTLDTLTDEGLKDPQEVPNKRKGTLPSTGGVGIVALLGFGVVAFGIAGTYFKRNGKEEV